MKTLELKLDELTSYELNNAKGGFKAGSDLSESVSDSDGGGGGNNDKDGDGLDNNIGGEYHE